MYVGVSFQSFQATPAEVSQHLDPLLSPQLLSPTALLSHPHFIAGNCEMEVEEGEEDFVLCVLLGAPQATCTPGIASTRP